MIEKILLGVALSAPIGPVSLEMIKRGLEKGFLGAFIVRLGGAVGNTLCLVAAYFGLRLFMHSPTTSAFCMFFGSLVLIYLGAKACLKKHVAPLHTQNTVPSSYNLADGLITGFVLSLANPVAMVFWLGIFAATSQVSDPEATTSLWGLIENLPIIGGVLLWGAFLSALLEVGSRFFNQKTILLITRLAGLMLIYFGLKYGYKAVNAVLSMV
jgi:L-lysine exporter family protein LysE/ArgO